MKCVGPTLKEEEIQKYREKYSFHPSMEEWAEFLALFSNPIRLKIFFLLQEQEQVCVCDLKDIFEISAPAMSQHLAKLKAYRMVKTKKQGQTVFYSLTDHPFLEYLISTQASFQEKI